MPKRNEDLQGKGQPVPSNEELISLLSNVLAGPVLGPILSMDSLRRTANPPTPEQSQREAEDLLRYGPLLEATVPRKVKAARNAIRPGDPSVLERLRTLVSSANNFDQKPTLNQKINDRNTVYHQTYGLPGIIRDRRIQPNEMKGTGVSVSRVPDINTFDSPFLLEIDPAKMPKNRPLAEFGFRKGSNAWPQAATGHRSYFEFENRTKNEPIPLEVVKRVLLKGNRGEGVAWSPNRQSPTSAFLDRDTVLQNLPSNIPVEFAAKPFLLRLLSGQY